ncbi:hypothetical protein B0H21DRAFT_691297 [Amylocystis lapponica]|nr:hypothetical protein B0H21DRAFT_691297 [Amylocystis lapponica]
MGQGEWPRVKGKGKGKDVLLRYDGEVIEGEHPALVRDPRKETKVKRLPILRPQRTELLPITYEYDVNSTGPPPATSVLVTNLSPLTPNQHIRRHFSAYGTITSFEPQIDKARGGALGIVFIKFSSHEEAKRCVEREDRKQLTTGVGLGVKNTDGEEMRVVSDGEGKLLKAVLKELDERRRRQRDDKRRREKGEKLRETDTAHGRGTPNGSASSTPTTASNPWRANQLRPPPGSRLPPKPLPMPTNARHHGPNGSLPPNPALNGTSGGPKDLPPAPPRIRRPPAALVRARMMTANPAPPPNHLHSPRPALPASHSSSSTPLYRRGPRDAFRLPRDDAGPSRSPSPISRKPGQSSRSAKQKEHEAIVEELARNGFEHVTIDGHGAQLGGAVREEDVQQFFDGFKVDRVLRDQLGWYVTFQTADSARRAALVLGSGARTLAHHSVSVTVHPPPSPPSAPPKVRWDESELVQQAEKIILKDLRAVLEKDVIERIVGNRIRRLVAEEKTKRGTKIAGVLDESLARVNPVNTVADQEATGESKSHERGLKGLSFRKQKKRTREEAKIAVPTGTQPEQEEELEDMDIDDDEPPPKKARTSPVPNEDIESEDDDSLVLVITPVDDHSRKRATTEVSDVEDRVTKKARIQVDDEDQKITSALAKSKKSPKKSVTVGEFEEIIHEVLPDDYDFDVPAIAQVRVAPSYESSLSPPSSPRLRSKQAAPASPPPDPLQQGICDDDEDVYFARLALSRDPHGIVPTPSLPREQSPDPDSPLPFRVHVTGSARTEGYYKISHAEKSAYVAQYASRTTVNELAPEVDPPQQSITSSRSNRANARRRAQGLEEINQVQRAMALSKGESAATELVKFNQLQTRKKHLRFARSPIHDWGLYAMEKISRGEMVIEYVGEVIRAQVADKREKAYERQGIGSSYLFRIDEDLVVDATKKGNLGRLINHSCDPNCTAKIITINGEKKIVIYAKQDIELGSEITYDYHFPIEQDKIPCLCGSVKCRGYLN